MQDGLTALSACNGERVSFTERASVKANPCEIRSKLLDSGKFYYYNSGELPVEAFKK